MGSSAVEGAKKKPAEAEEELSWAKEKAKEALEAAKHKSQEIKENIVGGGHSEEL
jgi:vacuolar-type H+-ATPase subunit H